MMGFWASMVVTLALSFVGDPSDVVRPFGASSQVRRWGSPGISTKSVQYSVNLQSRIMVFHAANMSRVIFYCPCKLTQGLWCATLEFLRARKCMQTPQVQVRRTAAHSVPALNYFNSSK
jgi:hypothetical protein